MNDKQQYIANKLEKMLSEHSTKLEETILNALDNDKDFVLYVKSLSSAEMRELYEHFGIKDGVVKQSYGHLLSARYALDIIDEETGEVQTKDNNLN